MWRDYLSYDNKNREKEQLDCLFSFHGYFCNYIRYSLNSQFPIKKLEYSSVVISLK